MSRIRAVAGVALNAAKRTKRHLSPRTQEDPAFPGVTLRQRQVPYGAFWMPGEEKPERSSLPAGPAFAREWVHAGAHVVVIGAGFGLSSVAYSKQVGPRGQVSAFEPDALAHSVLRKNLDANRVDNVRAFKRLPTTTTETGGELDLSALHQLRSIDLLSLEEPAQGLAVLRALGEALGGLGLPIVFRCDSSKPGALETHTKALEGLGYRVSGAGEWRVALHPSPKASRKGAGPPSSAHASPALPGRSLCSFLRSRAEVESCTEFLHRHGYASHLFACKDWDLAHIIPQVGDGNFLDMGSSESFVLKNVMFKGTTGEKFGIDLRPPDFPLYGVRYLVGDLMDVPVEDGYFKYISCLSVVEHEVDFTRFAREASRLLAPGGKLFVTFDYWVPRVRPTKKLYGLMWQPLDASALDSLLAAFERTGLTLVEPLDRTLGEPVIREGYFSPESGIRYTFGLLTLEKKG